MKQPSHGNSLSYRTEDPQADLNQPAIISGRADSIAAAAPAAWLFHFPFFRQSSPRRTAASQSSGHRYLFKRSEINLMLKTALAGFQLRGASPAAATAT